MSGAVHRIPPLAVADRPIRPHLVQAPRRCRGACVRPRGSTARWSGSSTSSGTPTRTLPTCAACTTCSRRPSERGRGVATHSSRRSPTGLREHDCFRLYWVVQEESTAARRLYDDIAAFEGFIEYRMPIAADGPAITPPARDRRRPAHRLRPHPVGIAVPRLHRLLRARTAGRRVRPSLGATSGRRHDPRLRGQDRR